MSTEKPRTLTKVSVKCILEVVENLTDSGAYGRLTIWKSNPNYDLDWLFRPAFWKNDKAKRTMVGYVKPPGKFFRKGRDTVSAQCVCSTVQISLSAAFHRCAVWQGTPEYDLDHLFRPVRHRQNKTQYRKKYKSIEKKVIKVDGKDQSEYERQLRKHMGITDV